MGGAPPVDAPGAPDRSRASGTGGRLEVDARTPGRGCGGGPDGDVEGPFVSEACDEGSPACYRGSGHGRTGVCCRRPRPSSAPQQGREGRGRRCDRRRAGVRAHRAGRSSPCGSGVAGILTSTRRSTTRTAEWPEAAARDCSQARWRQLAEHQVGTRPRALGCIGWPHHPQAVAARRWPAGSVGAGGDST